MKNIKLFQKLIITLIFALPLLQSCTEENQINERKVITPEILSKNKIFTIISEEMTDYSKFIKKTIEKHKLSSAELIPRIDSIVNSNLSGNEQLIKLNELLNTDVSGRVKRNAEIISFNWKNLKTEYKINEEILQKAFEIKLTEDKEYNSKVQPCPWRYYLCLGAAYSGAVLCHAGCDTTALPATAGLGIPACVALCGSLQVFASVQCYDSYCAN